MCRNIKDLRMSQILRKFALNNYIYLKCPWHEIFYYRVQKSFQNDEEWRLFYCDSTLGCWVIQDMCDITKGTQSGAKSQKIEYLCKY